jgi:hypothetical protein
MLRLIDASYHTKLMASISRSYITVKKEDQNQKAKFVDATFCRRFICGKGDEVRTIARAACSLPPVLPP